MKNRILKVQMFKGREYVPLEDVLGYINASEPVLQLRTGASVGELMSTLKELGLEGEPVRISLDDRLKRFVTVKEGN